MKITKELLKDWRACADGYSWFLRAFPQGGDVHVVGSALREDKRFDDASWLTNHVFSHFIKAPQEIAGYVESDIALTLKSVEGSPTASSGDYSTAASSGVYSKAASSGVYSTAEAKGEKTIAMVAGTQGQARAGVGGAFALAWLDGEQMRIAVGMVGENDIKADTWYKVGAAGRLVEVAQ